MFAKHGRLARQGCIDADFCFPDDGLHVVGDRQRQRSRQLDPKCLQRLTGGDGLTVERDGHAVFGDDRPKIAACEFILLKGDRDQALETRPGIPLSAQIVTTVAVETDSTIGAEDCRLGAAGDHEFFTEVEQASLVRAVLLH